MRSQGANTKNRWQNERSGQVTGYLYLWNGDTGTRVESLLDRSLGARSRDLSVVEADHGFQYFFRMFTQQR